MKLAIKLYQSGAVRTKYEAARAASVDPSTLYLLTAPSVADPQVKQLTTQVDQLVTDTTVSTKQLVEQLSRKAIQKIGNLMEGAESERVQLDAAKDLADRGSETSKVQKHQVESWSLGADSAKALAAAMVEAAKVRKEYEVLETQDFIRLEGGLPNAQVSAEDEAGKAEDEVQQASKAQAPAEGQG